MAASTKKWFISVLIAVMLLAGVVSIGLSTQFSTLGKGPKDDMSLQGPKSDTGTMGAVRATGPTGQRGATGPQGCQGAQGPEGPKGLSTPEYDSGWINIADKAGQSITITHNLNTQDVMAQITGKMAASSGMQQRNYGLTGYISGWSRAYGSAGAELANSGIQTKDNGYALIGFTNKSSFNSVNSGVGNNDIWLIKTNSDGVIQWDQTYGGQYDDRGYNLIQTKDGGFALIGGNKFGSSRTDNNDVLFIKTDALGNMQWNMTYGLTTSYEWGTYVIETTDGGYAIAASAIDMATGKDYYWIIKTDLSGNMQWNQSFTAALGARGFAILQTADEGYATAGVINEGNADFGLIKTDSSGNLQWRKTYGGLGFDLCRGFVATRDGGFALAGFSTSFGASDYDIWLVKTDNNGNMQWNKTYGGPKDDKILWFGLAQTNDGYAIAGYTQSYGAGGTNVSISTRAADYPPGTDAWLVKTDSFGNVQWNKTFGGIGDDYGATIIKTNDGGLAIAGVTYSLTDNNWNMLLVKVGFEGESGLAWVDSTASSLMLYRGANDIYWNYVRVQIWKIR